MNQFFAEKRRYVAALGILAFATLICMYVLQVRKNMRIRSEHLQFKEQVYQNVIVPQSKALGLLKAVNENHIETQRTQLQKAAELQAEIRALRTGCSDLQLETMTNIAGLNVVIQELRQELARHCQINASLTATVEKLGKGSSKSITIAKKSLLTEQTKELAILNAELKKQIAIADVMKARIAQLEQQLVEQHFKAEGLVSSSELDEVMVENAEVNTEEVK